ncbi:MAG TPA: Gfo/Idh/MocA family oxidoreductase [Candidatus Limnocylindrales bacterium]
MDVGVAVIGCGALGRIHARCVSELDGVSAVAFCDILPDRAALLNEEFKGRYATTDPDRVFGDESVDAVYLTTLNDTHTDLCVRALEAGKHVLVEKPLALTVEECLRVSDAVERTGRKLMVGFKMRYYDMVRKAKELIPEPILVTMQMMDNRWPAGAWYNDPVKGGGNVLSQGCHSTDLLRFVTGRDPVEVYACGGNYYQPTGVVDNLVATFRFGDGLSASLVQGDANCPPVTSKFFMQLFAPDRSVTLTDRLTTLTYTETGKPPQVFRGSEDGFAAQSRDFRDCVRSDRPPPIDHLDGLWAAAMVSQAIESARSGKVEPVKVWA